MCIGHAGAHVFASAGQKCYRHTETLLDVEIKTLENTLADKITHAAFYAVADRLAEVKAETRLHALADTVEEVGAKTLYETLSNMKSETLV